MFDKFGEFDSCEELNLAAEGLFNEGDIDNIYILAEENGIDRYDAEMYIAGEIPTLSDTMMAAAGKIDVELKLIDPQYRPTASCIAEYIKSLCDREAFAIEVRKKGKSLHECMKNMEKEAEKQILVKKGCQCACIPPSEGFKFIRDYYLKGERK